MPMHRAGAWNARALLSGAVLHSWRAGEQRIQRQQDIMNAIAAKLERYKNPWQELKIVYGAAKGKAYTEEEDRFLVGEGAGGRGCGP